MSIDLKLSLSPIVFCDETLVKEPSSGALQSRIDQQIKQDHVMQYILVRTDIRMSVGKIAAQVAHASVECYRKLIHRMDTEAKTHKENNQYYYAKIHNKWANTGTKKVVLNGGNESHLEALLASIEDDIVIHKVIDQGLTEINPDTLTCVGIGPDLASKLSPMFRNLELL